MHTSLQKERKKCFHVLFFLNLQSMTLMMFVIFEDCGRVLMNQALINASTLNKRVLVHTIFIFRDIMFASHFGK